MDSKQIFRTCQSKFDYTNWRNKDGEMAQNEGDAISHIDFLKKEQIDRLKWFACVIKSI